MPGISRVTHIFLMLIVTLNSPLALSQESVKLAELLDQIHQYELSVSPLMASREDVRKYDHLLPDISPSALKKQNSQWQSFRDKVAAIDDAKLNDVERINKLMQLYRLDNKIAQYKFNGHWIPITSEYGFHSSLANLSRLADVSTAQGVENYLLRLGAVKGLFEQNIRYMKQGLDAGMAQPKAVMQGFEDSVTAYIKPAEDSAFYRPFTKLDAYFDKFQAESYQKRAKDIINQSIMPAYQDFNDFLVNTYIPNAPDKIGAIHWPQGEAYYANRARHYTTTSLSAKQIHQLGLDEVARIRTEMQEIIESLEFDGSFADFVHFLRTDPQFYATSATDLLKHASYYAKKADAKLPSLFEKLPRTPYGVAPVPDSIAPKYTTGRYISPSNDSEPGYYWVNTYALDKRPLYAIPALTLHEAVPGHHMQIMLANENNDLSPVRKTYISAFGEGWGLYSEFLGIEADIYESPYDHFGRLSYEMWRACRLVVDTGMHMFGWSRQQAIDYMSQNTALSEHNVRTEIDRYISWPAQALSYKIGEIRIRELRRKAEKALKQNFDVRQFHSAILEHGSIPLFVLEQNIDKYIEKNLP